MQPHNFFSTDATPGTPTRRHALGRLPTPPPLPENLLLRLHKNCPLRPCDFDTLIWPRFALLIWPHL